MAKETDRAGEEAPGEARVEGVAICGCTNTRLERGETCGMAACPNAPDLCARDRKGGEGADG